MKRTRVLGWAARVALVLALAPLSACLKDDSGSGASSTGLGANTPLTAVWVDQSAPAGGGSTDTPLSDVWVDATTVTATGAGAILPSIDEVTYSFPVIPAYIPGNGHPLMTHSSAAAIVNPEDQLLTLINNYRLQTLGNNNAGLGNNNGGLGVPINGITVTAIPPSGKLRKNARAHCKHYGRYITGPFPLVNEEGDDLAAGGVNPQGRLPKSLVQTTTRGQTVMSGAGVDNAQNAFNTLQQNNSAVLTTTAYNYIGIGHWPQGDQSYYWNIILATGVNPVN